jgi:hypothetical protein
MVHRLPVHALIDLKQAVDHAIAARRVEVARSIRELKQLL